MTLSLLQNPFFAQCLALSCIAFIGVAFGCLVKLIVFLRIKKSTRSLFAGFCLFLSFAVVFYTAVIFMKKNLFWYPIFLRDYAHYGFLSLFLLVLGAITAFFWKIVLPLLSVLYLSLTLFTNHVLNSLFENQDTVIPISIEEKSIAIGSHTIEKHPENFQAVKISLYHLPDTLILPVKRNWFAIVGVAESPVPFQKTHDDSDSIECGEGSVVEFKNKQINGSRFAMFYLNHVVLTEKPHFLVVSLPQEKIVPARLSARIFFRTADFDVEISRVL